MKLVSQIGSNYRKYSAAVSNTGNKVNGVPKVKKTFAIHTSQMVPKYNLLVPHIFLFSGNIFKREPV